MTHIQPVALLTIAALLLIASPASAAWVCTARNDAGQRWTITRADCAAAATTVRQFCVVRGANGNHCTIGCQGGGWIP
jgi:phage-related tail fiber protein